RSEAYFVFPLAQGTPGKQCGLAATGVYQPSLRSPWLAAVDRSLNGIRAVIAHDDALLQRFPFPVTGRHAPSQLQCLADTVDFNHCLMRIRVNKVQAFGTALPRPQQTVPAIDSDHGLVGKQGQHLQFLYSQQRCRKQQYDQQPCFHGSSL
ncbi:hypothetical protein, partial [Thiolapillus sp.]|uniref:hypothetical protein n=1 Tax=Thiolapillus sp. TaxID=2017437 RepID=UPI003AF65959